MANCRPSSPIKGEPKVMQSGRLVFEKLNFSSNDKVKRVATDPPREFPVIINGLELSICIMILYTLLNIIMPTMNIKHLTHTGNIKIHL